MKTALRYALLLTLLSIFCLDASAARKRPRKRAKKNAAEAVAPDTVYIIKYVQPVDTAEVPQRPKFGDRGCTIRPKYATRSCRDGTGATSSPPTTTSSTATSRKTPPQTAPKTRRPTRSTPAGCNSSYRPSNSPTTLSSAVTSPATPIPATVRSAVFWGCRNTISR